jgi:hypothetical protein
MRDWKSLIEQRLGKLKLPKSQREEVVNELAAHLEDLTEDEKACGFCDTGSTVKALCESTDWPNLARKIQKSKRDSYALNQRSRTFWLPALITLSGAEFFWAILMRRAFFGFPRIVHQPILFLATLPLIGALGACTSKRGGGGRIARMAAGVFPVITMFGVLTVIIVGEFVTNRGAFKGVQHWGPWFVLPTVILLPILASLAGTLPFMRDANKQSSPHESNNSNQDGEPCGNR